jgi:hypothetical protein
MFLTRDAVWFLADRARTVAISDEHTISEAWELQGDEWGILRSPCMNCQDEHHGPDQRWG